MGKHSRDKGARGEREFAELLRGHGIEAERGRQHSGGSDSPDVRHALNGLHFEVKRCERLQLWQALEQAQADAGERVPVVAHRSNRRSWVVVLSADDFLCLIGGFNDG